MPFWLVGAGGTGSFMAMNLARLAFELRNLGKQTDIIIVDPDRVEEGNIPRSNFCFAEIGSFKAETLAGRITGAWGMEVGFANVGFQAALLEAKSDDWQVKPSDSKKLIILVGCVDNHRARLEMHEAVKFFNEKSYYRDSPRLWWIDGGNGSSSGQVLIGNRAGIKKRFMVAPESHRSSHFCRRRACSILTFCSRKLSNHNRKRVIVRQTGNNLCGTYPTR